MFLDTTSKRNPKLIAASLELHQRGIISPNTYVIDLDTVKENARILVKEAKKHNIELYMMTKQFGRNPLVAKAVVECGIKQAVAVDPWEAISLARHGISLGHVGHLVQIPQHLLPEILHLSPDYITVFSLDNAKMVNKVALQLGIKQNIFLRMADQGDHIYNGQEGGFSLAQLQEQVEQIEALQGVHIAGLTSFPCIIMQDGALSPTHNVETIKKAKAILEERGHLNLHLNMPSATSVASMPLLEYHGATQGEPGHALTGTTPLHAVDPDQPEKPAMIYVSEVSHIYQGKARVFGGGFYPRSQMRHALVGKDARHLKKVPIVKNDPSNIDYYGTLDTAEVQVGDTAIFAFRTQIFVTNSNIAVIENVESKPTVLGIFDSVGNPIIGKK